MEADLDMKGREEELDEKGRSLIDQVKPVEWLLPNTEVYEEWEENEEDEDVDLTTYMSLVMRVAMAQRIPMRSMGKRRLPRTTMRM